MFLNIVFYTKMLKHINNNFFDYVWYVHVGQAYGKNIMYTTTIITI
jgi:hypothetical protein